MIAFQLSYFKSWRMMLLECCTQHASKLGKLICSQRTGKGQFSFQSQRKAMPKIFKLPQNCAYFTWKAAVHGIAKGWIRLSDFTFTFHFHALEKEMATHSSVLAWRIPGTGEPSGLPSMGSHRVGHDWSDLAAAAAAHASKVTLKILQTRLQ